MDTKTSGAWDPVSPVDSRLSRTDWDLGVCWSPKTESLLIIFAEVRAPRHMEEPVIVRVLFAKMTTVIKDLITRLQ